MKEFKSFYKTVGGNEGNKCHYPTRLDTYGCGCQHDCKYCYAKSLLEFRNLWDSYSPAVADIDKIRRKVKRLDPKDTIRLGGMTDCFQPLEREVRNTYHAIEALNEVRIPYLIVTKSALVANPEYLEVMDKDLAHIQVTLTCTDDEVYKKLNYERASLPHERIEAIERLQDAGFDVQVRLSPYIPEFIDLTILNSIRCDKILVGFLRINPWIQKWFGDYIDITEYSVKQNGYKHLPLDRKKDLITGITGFKEITVCEDESEAYEYWKNHFNPNKEDCCDLRRFLL